MRQKKGIMLMLLTTFIVSAAQFFLKKGTETLTFSLYGILTNFNIMIGVIGYIIAGGMMVFALKHGELNVIYPIVSLSFVWVTLISVFLLKEPVGMARIIGIVFVLGGVVFITRGAER